MAGFKCPLTIDGDREFMRQQGVSLGAAVFSD
jgi:hypothetical protein